MSNRLTFLVCGLTAVLAIPDTTQTETYSHHQEAFSTLGQERSIIAPGLQGLNPRAASPLLRLCA